MSLALRSSLWVAAQFALIALMLAWPGQWRVGLPAQLLGAAALALAAWVLSHNRPGNFNVRPQPKPGARLVLGGPYRFMRHPMYSSLLLGMAAVAAADPDPVRLASWLALCLVLLGKSSLEERLLMQRWPEYAEYRARTGRFMPRLRRAR
jgi:protein-S-isoprenylcysteine O-methyltransferase Ste14